MGDAHEESVKHTTYRLGTWQKGGSGQDAEREVCQEYHLEK